MINFIYVDDAHGARWCKRIFSGESKSKNFQIQFNEGCAILRGFVTSQLRRKQIDLESELGCAMFDRFEHSKLRKYLKGCKQEEFNKKSDEAKPSGWCDFRCFLTWFLQAFNCSNRSDLQLASRELQNLQHDADEEKSGSGCFHCWWDLIIVVVVVLCWMMMVHGAIV